ncbi:MAG: ATP-binding protein [Pseudomonadota bacterium]
MFGGLRIGRRIGVSFMLMLVLLGVVVAIASVGIEYIVGSADALLEGNRLRSSLMEHEIDHMEWEDELYTFLTDRRIHEFKLPLEKDQCKFGKWLRSTERHRIEAKVPALAPLLKAIEEPHQRLHESAKSVAKNFRHADHELPRFLLEQALTHLQRFMSLGNISGESHAPSASDGDMDIAQCPLEKWSRSRRSQWIHEGRREEIQWHWDRMDQAHVRLHSSARSILEQTVQNSTTEQNMTIFFGKSLSSLREMLVHLSAIKDEALRDIRAEDQADEILRNETFPSHQLMLHLLDKMRVIVDREIVTDKEMLVLAQNIRVWTIGIGIFNVCLAILMAMGIKRSIVVPLNHITGRLASSARTPPKTPPPSAVVTEAIQTVKAEIHSPQWKVSKISRNIADFIRASIQRPLTFIKAFQNPRGHTNVMDSPRSANIPMEVASLMRAVDYYIEYQARIAAMQQKFIANVAHQLKNPLAGIYMQIDMVADDLLPKDNLDRIQRLRESIHKIGRLIHQLLALARCSPEATDEQFNQVIQLDTLIEENASEWFNAALARQMDLGFEIEPVQIRGLNWLVREMLINLIDNAVKYCPPGSRITIRCGHRPTGQVFLEVEDDGPGIPLSEQKKVFERFYRFGEMHDTRPEGSGLGLAIVKDVAECLHATVNLDTPHSSTGTRVAIRFPQVVLEDRGHR